MRTVIVAVVVGFLIANFVHFSALKQAKKSGGWLGVIKMSMSILIHQSGDILIFFVTIFLKILGE